jgi:hypothetical protein
MVGNFLSFSVSTRHVAAAAALLLGSACAGGAGGGTLDPELRRVGAAHPGAMVDVIVQVEGRVGPGERAALIGAGLRIETVVNGFVTGELAAGRAQDVARLPFVRHVELSRHLRPLPDEPGSAGGS